MNIIPRKFYLDDLFDSFAEPVSSGSMKCDIYKKDNNYHIEMDIPGYNKEDVKIEADKGYLTITAEKSNETNDEDKNYIRRERSYGKYQRSFYLGDIDNDGIKAEFKNGTLSISVPSKVELETKKSLK